MKRNEGITMVILIVTVTVATILLSITATILINSEYISSTNSIIETYKNQENEENAETKNLANYLQQQIDAMP